MPKLSTKANVELTALRKRITELETENKKFRQAADSPFKFRILSRHTHDAILVARIDNGRIIDANDIASKTFGYTTEELLSLRLSELRGEYAGRSIGRQVEIGDKLGYQFGAQYVKKDGKIFPAEVFRMDVEICGKPLLFCVVRDITERKQIEEEIVERGAMLQQIMDTASVAISIVDKAGRITHANRRMGEMFGRSMSSLIGCPYVDLVHPSEREIGRKNMLALLTSEIATVDVVRRYLREDGREFWGHLACRRFHDARGNELGLIGVITDITEHKKAEEALRDSEERFRSLSNASLEGIMVHDHGMILDVNLAFTRLFGYEQPEELIGNNGMKLLLTPESQARIQQRIQLQEQGLLELTCVRKNGSTFAAETESRPAKYLGRNVRLVSCRDITERKHMEKELREKEAKYRSLFESAKDGIFIHDETGFTDCNQKGAEMYGLTKEEIIGRSPGIFAPERQPDGRLSSEVAGEKIRAALSGTTQVFEWQPIRANGSPFDVEITLSPLELGGKMCLQAIVRDISERKRLEQERLKTQKLEAIGTLAGGIAHDFNNLLQGVFGYISLAKLKKNDREKSLSALEEAEKALHMTVRLTNQLLTFSKGGKPVKKPVALQPIIENAAKFALSGSRSVYNLAIDGGLWLAEADEGQISQVIQNIVLNADQSMPEGGQVKITARNIEIPGQDLPQSLEKGKYIAIAITDSGIGILKQFLGKIFDPYFTTKEKGSGLGLATSYSIIKNHNGVIEVKSEVGKGTTFTIYLQASSAMVRRDERTMPAAEVLARKGRVLVMDDEPVILDVAGELIRALGHSVDFATQGHEAVEKYRHAQRLGQPFDVVILDLTIRGGMGGSETLQRLLKSDPHVKAVVSSGYSDDTVIAGYRDAGFKAFLKKPYNVDELRETLNHLLSQ